MAETPLKTSAKTPDPTDRKARLSQELRRNLARRKDRRKRAAQSGTEAEALFAGDAAAVDLRT
jgi:hypothetical protein